MNIRNILAAALTVLVSSSAVAIAQPGQQPSANVARERAREPYKDGLAYMQREAFEDAVKSFEAAITIDSSFDMAHYMLGRAHMARKVYTPAVIALTRARNLFAAEGTRQFETKQDLQRYNRSKLAAIDDLLLQLRTGNQSDFRIREQIRQLEERKRQFEDRDRTQGEASSALVPAFVSLALGSAHFRSGNMPEAEKAWRDAIAVDAKIGEAHSNLAVVYMTTGRFDDAEKSIKSAEKAGFKVNPELKEEIKNRKKAGTL